MRYKNRVGAWLTFTAALTICGGPLPGQGVPGSLRWYANNAKQRGQTSITLKAVAQPVSPPPLKDLLKRCLVVDGEIESVAQDSSNDFHIFTWYKLLIFTRGPSPAAQGGEDGVKIPSEISTNSDKEIMLRVLGGTAVVDGVTITQNDGPTLVVGKRYLFFLDTLSQSAFRLAPESLPITLMDRGQLPPVSNSPYSRQLSNLRSVQDLLNGAQ